MQKLRGQSLVDAIKLAREGAVGPKRQESAKAIPTKVEYFDPKNLYWEALGTPGGLSLPQAIERAALIKSIQRQFRHAKAAGHGGMYRFPSITGALRRALGKPYSMDASPAAIVPDTMAELWKDLSIDAVSAVPQKELDRIKDIYFIKGEARASYEPFRQPFITGRYSQAGTPKELKKVVPATAMHTAQLHEPMTGATLEQGLRRIVNEDVAHELGHARIEKPEFGHFLENDAPLLEAMDMPVRVAWNQGQLPSKPYSYIPEETLTRPFGRSMGGMLKDVRVPVEIYDQLYRKHLYGALRDIIKDPSKREHARWLMEGNEQALSHLPYSDRKFLIKQKRRHGSQSLGELYDRLKEAYDKNQAGELL